MQCFPKLPRFVLLLSSAACLAMCAIIRPAWAQQIGGGGISVPDTSNPSTLINRPPGMTPPPPKASPADVAPAALPGAVARGDRVAPAKGIVIADPNEALFDAINRGDITSARDALDRGADLEGHNVLGMTPIDLSVDLGRNDITFLLLSLRNGDLQLNHRGSAQTAKAAQGTKSAQVGTKAAPANTRQAARAPATPPAKQGAQITSATPVVPRLFAGDGGTPNLSAGFLGFDNRP
jgi:hypothetical protein